MEIEYIPLEELQRLEKVLLLNVRQHAPEPGHQKSLPRAITRDQRPSGELPVNSGGECRHRKITRH
jgi:hypothetical protein